MTSAPDIFGEARSKITIPDAWELLALPGTPKPSCKSPFREDKHPSFSIHSNGTAWTDHASGDGGDVVEFIRHALGGDHKEVREWLIPRIGTTTPTSASSSAPATPKRIDWPGELIEGTRSTWKAFARHRGLTFPAAHAMIEAGILRFTLARNLFISPMTALQDGQKYDNRTFHMEPDECTKQPRQGRAQAQAPPRSLTRSTTSPPTPSTTAPLKSGGMEKSGAFLNCSTTSKSKSSAS